MSPVSQHSVLSAEGQATAIAESILASPKGFGKYRFPAKPAPADMAEIMPAVDEQSLLAHTLEDPLDDLKLGVEDKTGPSFILSPEDEVSRDRDQERQQQMCSLFVGDLARNITEENLLEVFSPYGEVVKVNVKRDKITGHNLGYGFIQFKDRPSAEVAKDKLEGTEIGGRRIRLGWAQKNATLFIAELDPKITTEDLRREFSRFGPVVEDETFVRRSKGPSRFGFVRFQARVDAERAKAALNAQVFGRRQIRVGWGDHNIQKHCVYVTPQGAGELTEDLLLRHFSQFGGVKHVTLVNVADRVSGGLKRCAFVNFEESDAGEKSAAKAIMVMSCTELVPGLTVQCSYGKRQTNKGKPHGHKGGPHRRSKWSQDMYDGEGPAPQQANMHPLHIPPVQGHMHQAMSVAPLFFPSQMAFYSGPGVGLGLGPMVGRGVPHVSSPHSSQLRAQWDAAAKASGATDF